MAKICQIWSHWIRVRHFEYEIFLRASCPVWCYRTFTKNKQLNFLYNYLYEAIFSKYDVCQTFDGLTVEIFSRRRWTAGWAQWSNIHPRLPCMWLIMLGSFHLCWNGPLSSSAKELHGVSDFRGWGRFIRYLWYGSFLLWSKDFNVMMETSICEPISVTRGAMGVLNPWFVESTHI